QQGWAASQILAEREHFIQQVMQATPNIIHVFDLDSWRTIYSNRPFTSLIGYPSELLEVGGTVMMPLLLSPEDQERLATYYHQLAENSETHAFDIEYRIKLGDGQTRWVLSRDQVFMRDEAGCARQILSMCQDITERKAAEHALATSEAQLRALRDALPDLMFILHVDGTILDYHAPPHTYLLLQPEDFLGKSFDMQMPPNIAQPARNAIHQVLAKGGIETFEYNLLIDGRQFAYEARIVHIVGDTCLCIIHDITARYEAAAALVRAKDSAEAADRAKSTFLAHISHEIRTPLTAIIGMASLLLESNLSTSQHENAAIIRTAGEALLSLIGNILDFSKIEAGQLELATQPFDLRTTCRIALDLVYHAAAHKGLTLDWEIDPHVPAIVIGDGGRLRQVLVNLLSNAIKFTERGDVWLTVHSRVLETDVCEAQFIVRDTGIGIAPDKLVQIFKPFVQVDHVLTRKTGGTGLGLAISQQLVELMGGRLEVESAFGFGTTFTLILPLGVAVACPAQPEEKVMSAPLTALRILIAEDNPINQEVLRRMLEQLGTLPTVVSDGKAALVAVSDAPFDLVLMDIQMPILDGEAATKQIRKLGTAIVQPRIIALTASALRGDRERYLEAGMDDYLSKPVQLEDLRRLLVPLNNVAPPVAPSVSPLLRLSGMKSAVEVNAQLDWSTVERLLGSLEMPRDQAAMLVCDLYERELPIQLAALSAAIEAEDRIQAARLAHKLRGGSRQLGALALASACATLEATAKDVHNPALVNQLKQVHQIYNETLALIQYRLRISA
ncbi:MAG: response regulator, partial [Oscillochloris sp.]|nr:response regulator [Oscillochloris sp.]